MPQLIWLSSAPGFEEHVIAGIQDVVGPHVPIMGGSAADEAIDGHWMVAADGQSFEKAAVVSVLFPSTEVMYAFHSGYEPTNTTGTVTSVEGRTLLEIDGRPAAKVYDEWTGGSLTRAVNPDFSREPCRMLHRMYNSRLRTCSTMYTSPVRSEPSSCTFCFAPGRVS